MNILVTGGSGMIGSLVIDAALSSNKIDNILSVVRKPMNKHADKYTEILHTDFSAWQNINFSDIDAIVFCLGAYTGAVNDESFKQITVDYPVSLATEYKKQNPNGHFILLSGQGADRTEKSRISFARYKGMAENQIAALKLARFNSFRPSYIYPVTPRVEPNFGYRVSRWLYPVFKLLGSNFSITSVQLANAMLLAAIDKREEQIIENKNIVEF